MVSLNENALVVQGNPIIEGRYSGGMTPREMDLLCAIISTLRRDDQEFMTVRIQVKDLAKLFGLENSGRVYQQVFEISERLLSRVVSVYDADKNTYTQFQWLSKSKYYLNEGYAEYRLNDEMRPYLLNLQAYTKHVLKVLLAMDSFYAKRLYHLLLQYRNTRKNGVWERTITLEELRKFLGIAKKEYKLYGHFKVRVIDTAKGEINNKTDISFDYEELKESRKVSAIRFIVRDNKADDPEAICEDGNIFDRLHSWHGMPEKEATAAVKKLGEAKVLELVATVEATAKAGELKKSALAFLRHLIKTTDRAAPTLFDLELEAGRRQEQQQAENQRNAQQERERQIEAQKALEGAYNQYRQGLAMERFAALPEDRQAALKEAFLAVFGNTKTLASRYKKEGLNNPLVRSAFAGLIADKVLTKAENLSLEAFQETRPDLA